MNAPQKRGPKGGPRSRKVYALLDPRDTPPSVRYVGCTASTLKGRLRDHLLEALRYVSDRPKDEWIREVIKSNNDPIAAELESVPPDGDWEERERFWIARFKSPLLTNVAIGGGGAPGVKMTELQKQRVSEVHTGRKRPPETAERISRAIKGVKRSDDVKRRISETKRANPWRPTPEQLAKMSSALAGVPKTDEHKLRISEAKLAPEARQRNREMLQNLIWINDGTSNKRVPRDAEIPEGWKLGRALTDKQATMYQSRRKA